MTLWSRSVKSGRVGQRCIKSSDRYKSNEHHRKSKHGAIITISIQGHNTKNQRSLNKGGKKLRKKQRHAMKTSIGQVTRHQYNKLHPPPSLPSGMATVNAQVAASHEAASIAEQEDGGTAVLLRAGQTAQHVLLGPLVAALGEVNEELLHHGGDDVAGGDGVDADVVLAPFGGEVAAELDDGCFARVVGGADEAL